MSRSFFSVWSSLFIKKIGMNHEGTKDTKEECKTIAKIYFKNSLLFYKLRYNNIKNVANKNDYTTAQPTSTR